MRIPPTDGHWSAAGSMRCLREFAFRDYRMRPQRKISGSQAKNSNIYVTIFGFRPPRAPCLLRIYSRMLIRP